MAKKLYVNFNSHFTQLCSTIEIHVYQDKILGNQHK